MSLSTTIFFALLVGLGYAVAPFTLVYGWIRWSGHAKQWTISYAFSFTGFVFATASAALAIATVCAAQVRHFGFYDPALLRIMKWGALLSLSGVFLACGGLLQNNPLRFISPLCALGTLSFWLLSAAGE